MAIILVVDDEVQLARSIERILRRNGHEVRTAPSAAAALPLVEGIDVLLTDVRMAGTSGLELVAEVKRRHPRVRCCIMSGDPGGERVAEGQALIDGRLAKPFSHAELLELVRGGTAHPRELE